MELHLDNVTIRHLQIQEHVTVPIYRVRESILGRSCELISSTNFVKSCFEVVNGPKNDGRSRDIGYLRCITCIVRGDLLLNAGAAFYGWRDYRLALKALGEIARQ